MGQSKYRALSELLEELGVELDDVKSRLARGVPLSTPTPPKQAGKREGALSTPVGRQDFQISTPPLSKRQTISDPSASLRPPPPSSEVDELKKRLEAAEIKLAAQSLGTPKQDDLLERQTRILERLAQPKGAQSTIVVKPEIKWPKLDDSSTGPKDAEDFFKKFEGFTNLANNGADASSGGVDHLAAKPGRLSVADLREYQGSTRR